MNTKYWKIANSKTPKELAQNFYETAKVEFQDLPVNAFSVAYEGKMNDKAFLFSNVLEREKTEEEFKFGIGKYELSDKSRPGVLCYRYNEFKELIFGNYQEEYGEKFRGYAPTDTRPEPKTGKSQKSIIYLRLEVENEKLGLVSLQSLTENIFTDRHVEMLKNLGFYVSIALKQMKYTNERIKKIPAPLIETVEKIKNKKKSEKDENEKIIKSLLDVVKELWNKENDNSEICQTQSYGFALFTDKKQKEEKKMMTGYFDELEKYLKKEDIKKGTKIIEKYGDRVFYKTNYFLRWDNGKLSVGGWCYTNAKGIFMNDAEGKHTKNQDANGKEDDYNGDCALYGIDPRTMEGAETQSILYYPLYDNNKIFGLFSIQNTERYAYTDYDFEFFKTVAPFVARTWINSQNPLMKSVRECYRVYENNKKNPKMIKLLAKEVAERIFRKTSCEDFTLSLCLPNETDENVLNGKKYEKGEIQNYQINLNDENGSTEAKVYASKKESYTEGKKEFSIPLLVQGKKDNEIEIVGVITACSGTEDDFLEEQRNALTFLCGYIAQSIDSDRTQLSNFHTKINTITEIDYENLVDKSKAKKDTEMAKLYDQIYSLLFGEDDDNENLFSLTLWLKETATEQYRQDLMKNHYAKKPSKLRDKEEVNKQTFVLVDYCFEYAKNQKGKVKPVLTKHAAHLHDYNRPAIGYFNLAEQGKLYENKDYMELNEWHDDETGGYNAYKHYIDIVEKSGLTLVDGPFTESEWKMKGPQNDKRGLVTNSLLFYPVKVKNAVKGILSFQHAESYYFNESHRTTLKILATIIGISIENRENRKNFIENMMRTITHDIASPIGVIYNMKHTLLNLQIGDLSLDDSYFKDEYAEKVYDMKIFKTFKNKNYNLMPKSLEDVYSSLSGHLTLMRCINKNQILEHKQSFSLADIINIQKTQITSKLQKLKKTKSELDNEYWDKIDFDISECKDTIYSVPIIFERIFYNLMLNSFEHAFNARQDNPKVKISSKLQGNDLYMEYSNNGQSIEERRGSLNWIFDAGETTKKHAMSSGLGLYGVKWLIKDILDGEINCHNNYKGKVGIIFIIKIPNVQYTYLTKKI